MSPMILAFVGIAESVGAAGFMFMVVSSQKAKVRSALDGLTTARDERVKHTARVEEIFAQLIGLDQMRLKVADLVAAQESLKAERGRITITQAELDTVDGRLRELEEIERELEASGVEAKEELNILKKKEKDMAGKNDQLKNQINAATAKMAAAVSELQLSTELQERTDMIKTQLIMTQEKIDTLLLQIEQGNDQYFVLKRRYDALDIEYAQLYEKFAESEGAGAAG